MAQHRHTSCFALAFPSFSLVQSWRRAYQLVLQETDKIRLFKHVEAAEAAMLTRREWRETLEFLDRIVDGERGWFLSRREFLEGL